MPVVAELALQFLILSLLMFGGGNAVLPEMHRVVVEQHHWMNDATFAELFAIAQAAPGPNVLVVTLIGWQVAGLAGAVSSTLALCGPSSLMIYQFDRIWSRLAGSPWRDAIQRGIAPLAVGLVLSSGFLIARAADADWRSALLTAASVLLTLRWRRNPLWLIAGGAACGLFGLV